MRGDSVRARDESQQLDDASVLADQLQAEGDARGELLALEIAAVRAEHSEEARAINREAQRLRAAEGAQLWPKIANARLRAGLLIESTYPSSDSSPQFTAELTRGLRRLVVLEPGRVHPQFNRLRPDIFECDRLGPNDLPTLRAMRSVERLSFRTLDSHLVPSLDALTSLETLRALHVGALEDAEGRFGPAELAALARLELVKLVLSHVEVETLAQLGSLPTLRELDCRHVHAGDARLASALRELRGLEALGLRGARFHPKALADALASLGLRRLQLRGLPHADREELALRRDAFAPLCASETLEELHASLSDLDPRRLGSMPRLRALTLPSADEPGASTLPPLEHLGLELPVFRRIRAGVAPSLHLGNKFSSAAAQRELLARLCRLRRRGSPPLRRLDIDRAPFLVEDSAVLRSAFGDIEHLIVGVGPLGIGPALQRLPRLRRLTILNLEPEHHAAVSAQLPHVLVESTQLWPALHS